MRAVVSSSRSRYTAAIRDIRCWQPACATHGRLAWHSCPGERRHIKATSPSATTPMRSSIGRGPTPKIDDPPKVMRPGDMVDVSSAVRNWWSVPPVGFNSILEVPVHQFESFSSASGEEQQQPRVAGNVVVPNDIFGVPIRKDLIYHTYWYHRRALAGYNPQMQLYKWEWPGRNKKHRSQKRMGKGRMGRRTAPGKYDGVFTHPIRPKDWAMQKFNKRILWRSVKCMLSAKFIQNSIKVVDSFNVQSHKTKHVVRNLRNIVGKECHSAMLVHEGYFDVNDNFRWASAHIPSVHRENVEGVSVYNLLKYHQIIFTEAALMKLIQEIHTYPKKRGWLQKYATPDGKPAPVPEKIPGWNAAWIAKKENLRNAEFRSKELHREQSNWKWSHELKGALKIPKHDAFQGFRVKDFMLQPEKPVWDKLESLYVDDEPLDEALDVDEFQEVVDTLQESYETAAAKQGDLIGSAKEIEAQGLARLAARGRRVQRKDTPGETE